MAEFGETLRALRVAAQWRQVDLVAALGHQVARSTLANIETGREPPTPRVWDLIRGELPDWESALEAGYREARLEQARRAATRPGAAEGTAYDARSERCRVTVEEVRYVYTFRFSRSPEEILEVRRVRARESGVDGFDLKLAQTLHEGFRVEEECLWGGDVVDVSFEDAEGATTYLRRVDFGRRLRRGQAHVFATRSWVAADPEPDTSVCATFTVPCRRISFQLNFWGPDRPRRAWRYGPVAAESVVDDGVHLGTRVSASAGGAVSATFRHAEPGAEYGVGWAW